MTTRKYNKNCAAQNTNNGNTINKINFKKKTQKKQKDMDVKW